MSVAVTRTTSKSIGVPTTSALTRSSALLLSTTPASAQAAVHPKRLMACSFASGTPPTEPCGSSWASARTTTRSGDRFGKIQIASSWVARSTTRRTGNVRPSLAKASAVGELHLVRIRAGDRRVVAILEERPPMARLVAEEHPEGLGGQIVNGLVGTGPAEAPLWLGLQVVPDAVELVAECQAVARVEQDVRQSRGPARGEGPSLGRVAHAVTDIFEAGAIGAEQVLIPVLLTRLSGVRVAIHGEQGTGPGPGEAGRERRLPACNAERQ